MQSGKKYLDNQMMSNPQQSQNNRQNDNPNLSKDLANAIFLCKLGQETVQDIVTKTTDMFGLLKSLQLPNGTNISIKHEEEKKNRCNEMLKNISLLFKRLYKVYDKCLECFLAIDVNDTEKFIPIISEETDFEENKVCLINNSEINKDLLDEYNKQVNILKNRNIKIKEVMDKLRNMIWDINTMLAMRSL